MRVNTMDLSLPIIFFLITLTLLTYVYLGG
jgi:hypothetical protein